MIDFNEEEVKNEENQKNDLPEISKPKIIRQNLFFDINNARIPFLGKYNNVFISLSQEDFVIIQQYETQKIEEYGDKYKSVIMNKDRPLIKVKYDEKTKMFKKKEEVPINIQKSVYKRIVLQAKNVYVDENVVTTHWRVQCFFQN